MNNNEKLIEEARNRGQAGPNNGWVSDALLLSLADALDLRRGAHATDGDTSICLVCGYATEGNQDAVAIIEKVRSYADDRYRYGRIGRTVGSMRIASDLYAILGESATQGGEPS